jgi:hypothetical protein
MEVKNVDNLTKLWAVRMRDSDQLVDLFAENDACDNTRYLPTRHSTLFRFAPWVNSLLELTTHGESL